MSISSRALLFGLGLAGLSLSVPVAAAQDDPTVGTTEEIVVTGTRVQGRSRLDTIAPVDVVSAQTLSQTGTTELNQALAQALPSFNFPRPATSDGTDAIRPATLRGLAPDQVLVLVNGKRRQASALVNVNGTVGRGSAAVDMNTLPTAAIGAIEVLRDGASAQYGSDAIAGVINVRLREASEGGNVTLTFGQRDTTIETAPAPLPTGATWTVEPNRSATDGETLTLSAWAGYDLFGNGFVTVSGDVQERENTVRAAPDTRRQFNLIGTAFDPRENTFNRLTQWNGDPELSQLTLFVNAGYNLSEATELYGWASTQTRDARSPGFYRRATDDRNLPSLYPEGFLPFIQTDTTDSSAAGGLRTNLGAWDLDTSLVWGSSRIEFNIQNTLNVSLGPSSQRAFYAGALEYSQSVLNVAAVRGFDVGLASPLNVAMGIEGRVEAYKIEAGELNSYRNGGQLNQFGGIAAVGSQVFPGFQPANATDVDRNAVGAYIDLEANLTDRLLLSGALRAENYSDFGSAVTGKIAGRYDFSDAFAVRGAVSTGFRAPSLQQTNFTSTATNFISGLPVDILTVPAGSSIARTLGAKPLDAEESRNYALGFVARTGNLSLTADAYFIQIDDRILLSENLTQANVLALLPAGIGGIRFFQNGADTETTGIDLVASWDWDTGAIGSFDFSLAGSFSNTAITAIRSTGVLSSLTPTPTLFARINTLVLEAGQPKEKVTFTTSWNLGNFGATARTTYYGAVTEPGGTPAADIALGQKTLFDLEGRYDLTDSLRVSVGAENLFDVYPDATPGTLNATGLTSFSRFSPFGFNGRYVYGRVAFNW